MKDEFDELVKELNLGEVEDFEAKPAKYEVYLYSYDADQNILGESALIASYADPGSAIKRAKELIDDAEALERLAAEDAAFVSVEVETIVEREGAAENVGTLFADGAKIR